ncbi:hypothetical protein R3P38DRAFT_2516297 [Favolaschia claudopus]|uniref:Uncharacterized protein n=1 Tax=Favolaschia claudopus TaxID=2862362 RepID=A0AAW0CJN1_9AGAR
MPSSERTYVDLLFRSSRKYASWDPEIVTKVGDYGRITRGRRRFVFWRKRGTFLKEGNIFTDGTANKYQIPPPTEYGGASEGETWVVSINGKQVDLEASLGRVSPAIAQCKIKGAFEFSSGRGAVLVMNNDTISAIDPPGRLRSLLKDQNMRGLVVVSEVHSCSSYARFLSAGSGNTIALGLSVEDPTTGISGQANARWVRSTVSGNFRSKVDREGARRFCPLFRLVSVTEKATSTGLRGEEFSDGVPLPLPDAEPPWLKEA